MKDLVMTIIIIAIKIFYEKSLFQLKYNNKIVVTSEFFDGFSSLAAGARSFERSS